MSLVNKVAQSGLITLKLEDFAPEAEIASFDLTNYLFKGLVLREKDFRLAVAEVDWSKYKDQYLAVFCSADAIIPVWAYMLVAVKAEPFVKGVFLAPPQEVETRIFLERIQSLDPEAFRNARVVVKGCAERTIPDSAFLEIPQKLRPYVKSLFYGEPCSTVPVYKNSAS